MGVMEHGGEVARSHAREPPSAETTGRSPSEAPPGSEQTLIGPGSAPRARPAHPRSTSTPHTRSRRGAFCRGAFAWKFPDGILIRMRYVAGVEAARDAAIDHMVRQTQMDVVWYILPLVMD